MESRNSEIQKSLLIGQKLKEILKEKGISQRRLAKLAGYSQQYISAIVNNKTLVSIKALHRIAEVLNVPVSYFFEEDGSTQLCSETSKDTEVSMKEIEELIKKLPPEKRKKILKGFKEQLELLVA